MKIFVTLIFITCTLAGYCQKKSINVRTLGVIGNGQTDDTQALQKAIDYCGQHGYDVYIPAGTYMVSAVYPRHCLKVAYDGMEVNGDGDRTVLKNKDNNPNAGILLVEAADPDHKQIKGVRIDNFKIDGNKQNQTGKYEQKCLRINVSNTINEPADIVVYNMTCVNAYSGVLPTEGGGISLEGWDKSLRNDVMLRQNIEVYNCVCNDNGGWGIGTNWSSGFNIHNNITERNATMGITVWNSMNGTVQNNTANNNHDNDINLEVSDNIVVDKNTITSSAGGGGIKSHNCIHTIFSNNNITFNNEWYLSYGIAVASGIGFGEGCRDWIRVGIVGVTHVAVRCAQFFPLRAAQNTAPRPRGTSGERGRPIFFVVSDPLCGIVTTHAQLDYSSRLAHCGSAHHARIRVRQPPPLSQAARPLGRRRARRAIAPRRGRRQGQRQTLSADAQHRVRSRLDADGRKNGRDVQ